MKKIIGLILAVFCLFMAVSCNNGTTEVAPPAPTGVIAKGGGNPIEMTGVYSLEWNEVEGAVSYKVYLRSDEFPGQKVEIVPYHSDASDQFYIFWSEFKLLSLFGTGPYQFGVSAVGANGLESEIAWSNTKTNLF